MSMTKDLFFFCRPGASSFSLSGFCKRKSNMQMLSIYGILGVAAASSVLGGSLNTVRKHGQILEARQANTTTTSAALSITSSAFNAFATNNVGAYYGHAETEDDPSMYPLCNNEDVDIVVMGFLRQFNGLNELPIFDLGSSCESDGSTAGSAITCPELATNISLCQSVGKKIFLSIGGSSSNITFNTSSQATQAAQILWDVFGAGSDNTTSRPFGNVTLDGFDFGDSNRLPTTLPTNPFLTLSQTLNQAAQQITSTSSQQHSRPTSPPLPQPATSPPRPSAQTTQSSPTASTKTQTSSGRAFTTRRPAAWARPASTTRSCSGTTTWNP